MEVIKNTFGVIIGGLIFLALMAILVVGAYGAYYGWDWDWWLVLVVFFPGFALMFVSGIFSMGFALVSALFRSKAA